MGRAVRLTIAAMGGSRLYGVEKRKSKATGSMTDSADVTLRLQRKARGARHPRRASLPPAPPPPSLFVSTHVSRWRALESAVQRDARVTPKTPLPEKQCQ